MTAPNPADTAQAGAQPPAGPASGTGEGGDTSRAGQDLSREALEAELARARGDAAKYRQRARDNEGAATKLEEIEQAKKTEVERLTEKSEGLLHRAAGAETDLLKLRVALGAGIGSAQADEFASRLRGDTEDELKADAEQLAKFFGSAQASPPPPPRRGDPSQGAGGDRATVVDPLQAALESKIGIG